MFSDSLRSPLLFPGNHTARQPRQSGGWAARFNGGVQVSTPINTYGFSSSPTVGSGTGYFFAGDIAEIVIFNRTLSTDERDSAGAYLAAKYNPSQFATNGSPPGIPTNFLATGIAPSQLNLKW